ncbi:MAG TPA: hypothetical protein VFR04_06135 [Solirubrobacterales bacterium]|nr:hypothetical protein [Solirubrobacterales bacterium]
MEAGEKPGKAGPLGVASTVVGMLAGIVAAVYLLGGAVIALRLLFDHFSLNSVVEIVGQLPRETVITTALLDVIGPAAMLGLLAGLLYAAFGRPRARQGESDDLDKGPRWLLLLVLLGILSVVFALPAIYQAWKTDGFSPLLLTSLIGIGVTYGALAVGWYALRRVGRSGGGRLVRALLAGAIWATVLLTPTVMVASALPFERAQVCTVGAQTPQKGLLIGEDSDRVLLELQFGNEAGVLVLPAAQVTRSEQGDISSTFACPPRPGQRAVGKVAEAALGGHGSALERQLATTLRPRLRFDSRERWRPLEVGRFLAERFADGGTHSVCSPVPDRSCEPATGLDQLHAGEGAPAFLDIDGTAENGPDYVSPDPSCRAAPPAVDCNDGPAAVMYYRRTTHEGRWYWDYWWFFRYNDYTGPFSPCNSRLCSDHEGDWEGITVVTTPSLKPEIVGAIYAAHKDRVLVEATTLPRAGGHPLVFVAEGTHASYPFWCRGGCDQYATLGGAHLPEDSHNGAVPWGGNQDDSCAANRCVRPLPEAGHPDDLALPLAGRWAGWPGQWGQTCHEGCDSGIRELQPSPRSPGAQTRFKCPWAATRWALPASDGSGLSRSEEAGDAERLLAYCAAQRGGL